MSGNNKSEIHVIALPSLIHRMGGDTVKQAKQLALSHHCVLKRVRRSRNWQLLGESRHIMPLLIALRAGYPEAMGYLIDKVSIYQKTKVKPTFSMHEQLLHLLSENPNITLSEMMDVTHCSIAQARRARFETEDMDD
ncbi:ribosome recycling factor family protein [Vibrio tapetis]|uniref:Ribosome recycling factor n=1 Tax=Vibrio tapetis subsp. tapetis TaxID=1671868 RepID=A0A2N8ZEU3_9VIBR|nr:ribosome recycling factor family protein [Vibrio tapetis]SON50434.1 conserved protein of unknown function [Vibrio tapetis subsp. tapetis]